MGQSGPLPGVVTNQKAMKASSCNVLEGRKLCSQYSCGISMVLLLTTGTFISLCVTDTSLLPKQWSQAWWERTNSYPAPRAVPSHTMEVPTEPHVEVHTEVHTKFQWKPPGPYHVAYPRNYIFVLDEPDACSTTNPFLVLIVPVAAKNRAARDAIRKTWGNETLVLGQAVRLFFLLGLPSGKGSEQLQKDVEKERDEHHDLLQSNFLDSYHNLTIKTMMMLEWVASRCQNASYVMKIDSDMFLNVRNLVKMLQNPKTPKQNYITGRVMRNAVVLRNKQSKWYVPEDAYPNSRYPAYLLGMGYVFSIDLPKKLIEASKLIRPLYIEDVHVGICLSKLGIQPTVPPSPSLFKVSMPVPYNRCHYDSVITTILNGPARLLQCWEDLHKSNATC